MSERADRAAAVDALRVPPHSIEAEQAVLGGLMLANGYGPEVQFGAGILGLGLAMFGVSIGYWLADSTETGA
jgi:hypothetical protein